MEKIVVTGSAGRIGSLVAETLIAHGNQVIGVDLQPSRLNIEGYQHVQCRFDNHEVLVELLQGVDVVVHTGAMMSWHPKDNSAMFHANVTATQWLLDAAAKQQVRRFVFASSGEVYPEVKAKTLPVTEEAACNPISFYGLTKKMGEELVNFYQQKGLETVILRFPHTQSIAEILDEASFFSGPRFFLTGKIRQLHFFGNHALADTLERTYMADRQPKMIVQHGSAEGLPYMMHIADVRDTANGVVLAVTHPAAANETFNLGPDDVVEFDKALPLMAEIMQLPLVNVEMPGPAVRFITSNQKIKTLLGYQPQHTFQSMINEAASLREDARHGNK